MKAKQRNRPVTTADEMAIECALAHMHLAREDLRRAGSNNAAMYVSRAMKSTQGALNNARRMLSKQERESRGSEA